MYDESSESESIDSDDLFIEENPEKLNTSYHTNTSFITIDSEYNGIPVNDTNIIKQCMRPELKQAMILNRRKKIALEKIAKRLRTHLVGIQNQIKTYRSRNVPESTMKHKIMSRLGMPYFKDKDLYSCPYNEDYYKMKANNELPLQSYYVPRIWTMNDKYNLAKAVFMNICK